MYACVILRHIPGIRFYLFIGGSGSGSARAGEFVESDTTTETFPRKRVVDMVWTNQSPRARGNNMNHHFPPNIKSLDLLLFVAITIFVLDDMGGWIMIGVQAKGLD